VRDRTRRGLAVGLALAGVGFAASYGYAPWLVPASVRRGVTTLAARADPGLVLLAVGVVTGVLALLSAWVSQRPASRATATAAADDAGASTAVAGDALSRRHARLVAGTASDPEATVEPIRERLRGIVIECYRRDRRAGADARAAVDRGTWTEDRYAAAFLTGTGAVDYPLGHRLYAWLYPERAAERRVNRTLRAVERLCEARVTGYASPPPDERGWWDRLRSALGVAT
jgi:hypothetical protein